MTTPFAAQWVVVDVGCRAYNLLNVALYETLGHDAIVFVINQSKHTLHSYRGLGAKLL